LSFDIGSEADRSLLSGLKNLKLGALMELIAVLLVIISLVVLFFSIPSPTPMSPYPPTGMMNLALLLPAMLLVLVALVLVLVSYIIIFKATGDLKRYSPSRLGIGRTGMILQLLGLILIFLCVIAMVPTFAAIGPNIGINEVFTVLGAIAILVVIAVVLLIVGSILFGVMVMRLSEVEGLDPGFKTAGILYIASVILSIIPVISVIGGILALVSMILIYIYSNSSIKRLESYGMGPATFSS